jgi:hypothetical protein
MTEPDIELAQMVRTLKALPADDREFVLALLGNEGLRELAPHLEQAGARACSEPLAELMAACRDGAVPQGLTPAAAAALASLGQNAGRHDEPLPTVAAVGAPSLRAWAAGLLAKW